MKTLRISVDQISEYSYLEFGERGENAVTEVILDFAAWVEEFREGIVNLYVKRGGDTSAYPVPLTVDGTVATWLVSETDTYKRGRGEAEYVYVVGEKIEKTAVFGFYVNRDIGQPSTTPPSPYETWLDSLMELSNTTLQNAQDAENSAEKAETASKHYPVIVDNYWWVWRVEENAYVNTGVKAEGQDFTIRGTVAIVDELPETATQGTYYNVGEAAPYAIYMWQDGVGWTYQGQLQGPTGATFFPTVSDDGIISWTNDGDLPNPSPANIRGPQGIRGEKGDDAPDDYVLVQDTEPTSETNKIWIKSDEEYSIKVPSWEDHVALDEKVTEHDTDINNNADAIATINAKIPSQASAGNQLADKNFVNSSIQSSSAHFRGNWANWAAVPTSPELYPADDDGVHTPTSNDYMVIQDASDYPVPSGETALEGTWRFKYSGVWATNGRNGWHKEYQVNETPLTAAQLAALNSGVTAELIAQISTNENDIEQLQTGKQNKIIANGILKGDGAGGISAAVEGTDYLAPAALSSYRTAADQDVIDAEQDGRLGAVEQTTTATTIGPVLIATFDASAADMPLKGLTVNIEPVQAAGTPSPENPLPISGWTGVNVFDDPKYALKINWNQIRTDSAQDRTLDGITTAYDPQTHLCTITNNSRTTNFGSGSTQCVVSSVAPIPGHRYALLGEYHAGVAVAAVNGTTLRPTASVGSILTMSATTPNTGFRLRITSSYDFVSAHPVGDVYSFYLNIVDITQLLGEEAAATATYDQIAEMFPNDWYPYNAGEITCVSAVNGDPYQKIAVNWEDEAGTVYGGQLDVTNGTLTVDRKIVDLADVTASWQTATTNGFPVLRRLIADLKNDAQRYTLKCSHLFYAGNSTSLVAENTITNLTANYYNLTLCAPSLFTTPSELNAWTAAQKANGTPVQLSYKMATPIVYQLTPTQIDTLLGTNNIWADTGDVTVTYGAYLETVKAYADQVGDSILSAIAPLEMNYTASRAYTVGSFLFVGTKFYKVIAAIAEGGTITPDTNVTQTTVAEQLSALAVKPAILG